MPTKLAADLEAVHAGEHQVENDQIRDFASHLRKGKASIRDRTHAEAFLFQVIAKQLYNIAFIFNDQNLLCHDPYGITDFRGMFVTTR
jgi:hypothetical protein